MDYGDLRCTDGVTMRTIGNAMHSPAVCAGKPSESGADGCMDGDGERSEGSRAYPADTG